MIVITWGSDRLCVKTVKDSSRELPNIQPKVDYRGICLTNLEALSIQVALISRMKFILKGENVNTQKKQIKAENDSIIAADF